MMIKTKRLRYDSWRRNTTLFTVVILVRFVTGMHLVDSGLHKLIGEHNVQGTDTNMQRFVDGFFQLGFYWNWVGLIELLTAFLLMGQRLSAIGALLCLFIAGNVGVLGFSIGWGHATPQALVFCSALLLLVWDAYKLSPLFVYRPLKPDAGFQPYPEAMELWHRSGILLFMLSAGGFVLREMFPSIASLIRNIITLLFFLISTISYLVTEHQHKRYSP